MRSLSDFVAELVQHTDIVPLSWSCQDLLESYASEVRREVRRQVMAATAAGGVLLPPEAGRALVNWLFGNDTDARRLERLKIGLLLPWLARLAHVRPAMVGAALTQWPAPVTVTERNLVHLARSGWVSSEQFGRMVAGLLPNTGLGQAVRRISDSSLRSSGVAAPPDSSEPELAAARIDPSHREPFVEIWLAYRHNASDDASAGAAYARSQPSRSTPQARPPVAVSVKPTPVPLRTAGAPEGHISLPVKAEKEIPNNLKRWLRAALLQPVLAPLFWFFEPALLPPARQPIGLDAAGNDEVLLTLLQSPPPSSVWLVEKLVSALRSASKIRRCLRVRQVCRLARHIGQSKAGEELVLVCLEAMLSHRAGRVLGLRQRMGALLDFEGMSGGARGLRRCLKQAIQSCGL